MTTDCVEEKLAEKTTDLLIVGAGFVGLACACAMQDAGLKVRVIDQKAAPPSMPSRSSPVKVAAHRLTGGPSGNVIAVSPASTQFLTDIGAWELIEPAYITPYEQMEVVDGTGAGAISFHAGEAGLPLLGYIVDQQALIAALVQRATQLPHITLAWQQPWQELIREEAGYRLLMADGQQLTTPLLIGADGSSSTIREAVGLSKAGWHYGQDAIVCVAQSGKAHSNSHSDARGNGDQDSQFNSQLNSQDSLEDSLEEKVARQWFTSRGPLAMLPLAEPGLAAVIWSVFDAEQLLSLSDEDFCEALNQASEQCNPLSGRNIHAVTTRFSFPLMQQQAIHYINPGIAIIGDAAHTIHPLAGQGANLGFADARALASVLRQARMEAMSPGDMRLLRRYEAQRKPGNQLAGMVTEGFHRLFTAEHPALAFLRNRGLRLVDHNKRLKKLAVDLATGKY